MKKRIPCFVLCLSTVFLLALPLSALDFGRHMGGVILNEDCTQYYATWSYPSTAEGIRRYTDECYLPEGHQLRIMMLNPQAQRASYDAEALEPMWKNVVFDETTGLGTYMGEAMGESESRMVKRMKDFSDRGEDQYVIWIDHLRGRGVSPWISMRMNDDHVKPGKNKDWFLNSPMWRDHPEWRIASHNRGGNGASDRHQGLDYGQPEVFDYHLKIAFELIDRYDADGFEMDFMRHGRFFRHGQEARGREILNDFVRQVREHANAKAEKTGHPYHVAVRVAADPRDSWYLGFDVETWCREGLVDMVIPATFFQTTWSNVPVREWRRIVGEDVVLAPCLESFKNPAPNAWSVGGAWYDHAFAASWLYQGADVIYLFNHFGHQGTSVTALDSLEHAAALPRRNLLTFTDTRAEGCPMGNPLPFTVSGCRQQAGVFRLECGPKPKAPNKAYVLLASRGDLPVPKVWLNSLGPLNQVAVPSELTFENVTKNAIAFEAPLEMLNDGDNLLEITDPPQPFELNWVEIYYTGTLPFHVDTGIMKAGEREPEYTLAMDTAAVAAGNDKAFSHDYGASLKAEDGVLTLTHDKGYSVVRVVDQKCLAPAAGSIISLSGEVKPGAAGKPGDWCLTIMMAMPDAKGVSKAATLKFFPDCVVTPWGKDPITSDDGWTSFQLLCNTANGQHLLLHDGQVAGGGKGDLDCQGKANIYIGDGSGGCSGSAQVRNIKVEVIPAE